MAPEANKFFFSGLPAQRELCVKQQAQPEMKEEMTWVPIPADRPRSLGPTMTSSPHRRCWMSKIGLGSQKELPPAVYCTIGWVGGSFAGSLAADFFPYGVPCHGQMNLT